MAAPTPVSAFLHSATMVKAGVYLLGRFRPLMISPEWMMLFVPLGLLTMTLGGLMAVASTDIKELLAYSTISHLGLIVASYGFITSKGVQAAGFHILNHGFFKASLFLVAGIVAHEAGTRKISELKGLRKDLPITGLIAVVGGLAMAGVPPFNGFQSKELLFKAAYHTASVQGGLTWLIPGIAVLGSVFTFAYSMKFISLFFGEKNPDLTVHRPTVSMVIPGIWLMLGVLFITLLPQTTVDLIVENVAVSSLLESKHMHVPLIPHLSPALGMSFTTIGLGLGVFKYYSKFHKTINDFIDRYPVLTSNWWYNHLLNASVFTGSKLSEFVHHGLLRGYAATFFAGISVFALTGFAATSTALPVFKGFQTSLPVMIVLGVAVFAALSMIYVDSHISGVLTLSIVGAMIAIYYILIGAPDLALTQIVVETLSLIIFILILDKVPSFYGGITESKKIVDGIISVFVGLTVALTVLLTTSADPDKISSFFVNNAVSEGGGSNIVNVILVDFRAFDTMGEISVVAMAAISVLTLLAMRGRTMLPEARIKSGKDSEVEEE
jgi:multicomponent Na+:H+ antiporter subunit A